MAKGRRASVHPGKSKPDKNNNSSEKPSGTQSSLQTLNNDETATLNSSIMSGLSQSGNFFNDFKSFVQEFNAPSTLLKVIDRSQKNNTENNNNEQPTTPDTENKNEANEDLGQNWTDGPCIITTPNRANPNVYYLKGFKIDIETMRAFLKAIEANPVRNVTIHISRCNLTPEAFNLFISEANFSIINHLTLVGPLDSSKTPSYRDSLKKLFQVNLESLKLPCWNLDDQFLLESVELLQNNESLMLLSLDFNNFKRADHIRDILRLNRKLMMVSFKNFNEQISLNRESYAADLLEMSGEELKIYRSIKLKEAPKVPKILKSEEIVRKDGKVYFPGNNVFKKLIL